MGQVLCSISNSKNIIRKDRKINSLVGYTHIHERLSIKMMKNSTKFHFNSIPHSFFRHMLTSRKSLVHNTLADMCHSSVRWQNRRQVLRITEDEDDHFTDLDHWRHGKLLWWLLFSALLMIIPQPTVTAELVLMTKPSIYYTGERKEKKFY